MSAVGATWRKSADKSVGGTSSSLNAYLKQSELPLTSLLFVLPLIVVYEVGSRHYVSGAVEAFSLLQRFFFLFKATGSYLPALAVAGILLTWHIARGDSWRVRMRVLGGMCIESFLMCLPVIVMMVAAARYVPLAGVSRWKTQVVLSLGAGVYEELVFRLIAFTVLNLVLLDLLKVPKKLAYLLIVLSSAILFSAYHYLGSEVFSWRTFAFRTGAGAYFGIVFLLRGFGITAGSHACYDLIVVTWGAILGW